MPASTTSFLFPDINVWLALTYERHVHHAIARRWFEALGEGARLFFCRFTQLGLLRLLSSEAVMGEDGAMSQEAAWKAYDRWLEDERVGLLDEPADLERHFRSLTRLRHQAPKDWADSYLAAFAMMSHLTVVSFDGALTGKSTRAILLKE
jgi:toxin-antitoxin system PIN domain toxin